MPATVVIGAQWGDEGKGRVVDTLAARSNVVARFGGGDNAGHTVYVGEDVYKLHLLPSGILHTGVVCVLGNGMVINPVSLVDEIDRIAAMGVDVTPERLVISTRAHIITPAHKALDAAKEKARGTDAIGTTLRGIGPAYLDKTGRQGIRAGEMIEPEEFVETMHKAIEQANEQLALLNEAPLDIEASTQEYVDAAERLRPFLKDTTAFLNQQLKAGAQIVCEGAQGTLLDVDHGSYPFVTSSNPSIGGALTGLGFGPKHVKDVVGVAKSFSTRVGAGPMPTESFDEVGERLRGTGQNFWDEFGTTTGRPRRCGWLDGVMLRYACDVNGFTQLALTKMDILSGFDEIKLAVAYEIDGRKVDYPPGTITELARAIPVYETLPGWQEDLTQIRHAARLPEAVHNYVRRISVLCDVPVTMLSVGPERDQLIDLA